MLSINQSVVSKKYGKGVITRIITQSTGYVEVKFENGAVRKEMAFNLTDETGFPLKKAPKKAAPKAASPLKEAMSDILSINGSVPGDRNGITHVIWEKSISAIETAAQEVGNDFIVSVCNSVYKYMRCSDKQAYCLAKFAIDNNIKL